MSVCPYLSSDLCFRALRLLPPCSHDGTHGAEPAHMHRPRTLAPRLTRRLPHAPAQSILELRLSRRPPRTAPNTLEPRLLRQPPNPSSATSNMIPYTTREGHRHHKRGKSSCNPIYNCLPAYHCSSPRASPHGSTGTFMTTSHSIPAGPLPVSN